MRRLESLRPVALIGLVALLLSVFDQTSSAQRAKQKARMRTYTVDLAQSQISVHLTQEGLMARMRPNHEVAIKNFNSKLEISPKDETQIAVEVETETRSLTNIDKGMSDFERKEFHNILHNIVLEADKFPTIKFVSVSVTDFQRSGDNRRFSLNGDLTLRGVTRRVVLPVTGTINNRELRATGEEKFKQSDFGIKPYVGGLGAIKIGDEVKVSFVVVAKAS
ncbi:MAG: YceI family protein [Acidobacteria bacterium]|nr:YceI family protein [Acidobacteriota bacterium]